MKTAGVIRIAGMTIVAAGCVSACFGQAKESQPAGEPAPAIGMTPAQIEADWLHQDEVRGRGVAGAGRRVAPEEDAVGGCDGTKNGQWGFHTEFEDNPWWQVDLGKRTALDRLVLYNRGEYADRSARIRVLVSDDRREFRQVYEHDGTAFYGFSDGKPLVVTLKDVVGRYVRLQLPGRSYFHLDEVEVYPAGGGENLALSRPATQSSTSQWSVRHAAGGEPRAYATAQVLERGLKLADSLKQSGADVEAEAATLRGVEAKLKRLPREASVEEQRGLYLESRWAVRRMTLRNPFLDFDSILFVKRAPGTLPHVADQHYGWWSRPGGGIYLLEGFKTDTPRTRCLTTAFPVGSFISPDLSYDGKKVLFAYCRYYPQVAGMEKVDKEALPEDSFYHIFEMNVDGSGCRQLTRGRYDDFDPRYLPHGEIVFLSTRKGQFLQCNRANTESTLEATLPDSYVRCGGDAHRPCAVFTLHAMGLDGSNLHPISAFENFEWTPSVAADGRILYARWDYIDRFNGHFFSLWSTNPDGTNAQLVFKNYTTRPQCVFEARAIPRSQKLIFTATAHHSITGGSLVLLDRTQGTEGEKPMKRLTPEVCFPEAEGWDDMYYANPYPLSEEYYLVAWSDRKLPPHAGSGQVTDDRNPVNAMGVYVYDAFGNLEPLYRDSALSSQYPIPVRARPKPPVLPNLVDWKAPETGCFLVQDVYQGLSGVERGSVKRLRIVGVPPKTQPFMNSPSLGVSAEDPGKFVLGTVAVEADGSAYFRVPSGIPVFFQALDEEGLAVQTMRSLTYVQPQQTLGCVGCHEPRDAAPMPEGLPLAAMREPSKLSLGPIGSWPLNFGVMVQPVLDRYCVRCHRADSDDARARACDLTQAKAYENLMAFGGEDLKHLAFERDRSMIGYGVARKSKLYGMLTQKGGHEGVELDRDSLERLVTWMDTYAQRQGHFDAKQEEELRKLGKRLAAMLSE